MLKKKQNIVEYVIDVLMILIIIGKIIIIIITIFI